MTSGGEGEFGLFRVSYLTSARAEVPGLLQEAASLGIKRECVSSLKKIERRLRLDPLEFGELVGERRTLNLLVHVGSSPPLTVRFAINGKERAVFVLQFFLRPASL
jgi:hypothetical protein